MSAPELIEHVFSHEHGRLVATLSRRVGLRHIEAVEDAVQTAITRALERWRIDGAPDDPSAWLFRVAHHALLDELRATDRRARILERESPEWTREPPAQPTAYLASELPDDLLRMLLVCCDPALPTRSRLVLALKLLCGFDVREIALRLFTSEASVYKRLGRARASLRARATTLDELALPDLGARLHDVHAVLYALFTEGHLSSHTAHTIRPELCDEAIRLATLLADHPSGDTPDSHALLALMHLHAARIPGREDGAGALILLEEQDRTRWDQRGILEGLERLARSARGDRYGRYHAEASIAAEHCLSPSFAQTRWARIAQEYARLEFLTRNPMHHLARAVATAEWLGARAGLDVLDDLDPPTWLSGSYQWSAVRADLHRRCGHDALALLHTARALDDAPSETIRALLRRRLDSPEEPST